MITSSKNIIYCCALQFFHAKMKGMVGWEEDALTLTRVRCNVTLFKLYIIGVVVVLYFHTASGCLQRTWSF